MIKWFGLKTAVWYLNDIKKRERKEQRVEDIKSLLTIAIAVISIPYFTDSVILGHLKNDTKNNIEEVIRDDSSSLIDINQELIEEWEQQWLSHDQIKQYIDNNN